MGGQSPRCLTDGASCVPPAGMVSDTSTRVVHSLGVPCGIPHNETTFAALAKAQGYSTGLIGE